MIKSIEFKNFRNINGKYYFSTNVNVVFGKNNSGKSNFLDGIRLAFSSISDDYFRVTKTNFRDSDDSKTIKIIVELEQDAMEKINRF